MTHVAEPPEPLGERPSSKPVRAHYSALGIPLLAVVAALAIWLLIPMAGRLPPYEVELAGGSDSSADSARARELPAVLELRPGADLALELRPQPAHAQAVEARVFLARGAVPDARAEPVTARVDVVGSGALRLTVGAAALPEQGRLIILVGREGALPGSPSTGSASHGHGWQRFEVAFVVAAAAPTAPTER